MYLLYPLCTGHSSKLNKKMLCHFLTIKFNIYTSIKTLTQQFYSYVLLEVVNISTLVLSWPVRGKTLLVIIDF